jgi:hypothetical protein
MSDTIETAKDALEHAHHEATHVPEGHARKIAVLIATLAAVLAMAEMGEKSAQNAYLTHHITASDDWNFYQAKNIRSNLYALQADNLESQPNAADPAIRKRIDAARAQAARLDDDEKTVGRKQLMAKAQASERARDQAFHRYHWFETAVGALQLTIVLASVAVVTRVAPLAVLAGALGAAAAMLGLAVQFDLV